MKTTQYNPSKLEIDVAKALVQLKDQISQGLGGAEITDIKADYTSDNPVVLLRTKDADGDMHELVMQVIQRPDGLVK